MRRLNELMEIALQIPLAPVTKNRRLPTRLIDVGFRGPGKEHDEPRLVITANYPPLQDADEDQRYIALSYCWGPSEKAARQLMTKTLTLQDRLRQIPFSTLPKTHQDALQICTLLGVRYIWIDSLCIVQDDKSDWEREADQMGVVYARAYLTICAGQGNSSLDGFLMRTCPSNSAKIPFTSSLKPAVSGCFSLFAPSRECPEVLTLIPGKEFDPFDLGLTMYDPYAYDKNCSWSERGWTFQEAILSPRILFFGKSMVHVCSGDDLIYSEDAIYDITPKEVQDKSNRFLRNMQQESLGTSEDDMWYQWRGLISSYSCRSLTYRSDIFPALSALAKIWTERAKGDCLAGIFSSDLNNGLLWSIEREQSASEYLSTFTEEAYTAPSWSWASQPRGIIWVSHAKTTYKPEFQLLDSHVTLDGLSPYGRVKDGFLLLSTKICPIPSTRMRHNPLWWGFVFPYELLADNGTS
ncbi:HET domain-containing protein [Colletotrichum kahawae]|uniref:HET domain-containing protein n=1 Tax=Colletotrichum kahawae TaxID=34407 RepID=A0AAD9YK82_COLKA|nr:HET domain-containing protein [Colletotrichum kahawae]